MSVCEATGSVSVRKIATTIRSSLLPIALLALALPASAQELPPALQELRAFYASADSIHMRASVEVSIREPLYEGHPAPVSGEGIVEHWESGGMFRTRASLDPRLGLLEGFDYALGPAGYQLYNPAGDVLAVEDPRFSSEGLVQVPLPTPNPLYLPAAFLEPGYDACPGCQLTLDFLNQTGRWTEALSQRSSGLGPGADLIAPGGSQDGVPHEFVIRFRERDRGDLGDAGREVGSICRISSDGEVVTITLLDFQPVSGAEHLRFPRRILHQGEYPDAEEGQRLSSIAEYRIEVLEVNRAIDPSIFTIAPGAETAVWNRGEPPSADR